jgi:hypothetical protein
LSDEQTIATRGVHDNDLIPECVSLPAFCCVRICDMPATVLRYDNATLACPGETLAIFAFCPGHAYFLELP